MQITEFKSVVRTFADPGSDLLFDSNTFVISVNGDIITANIVTRLGDVYIDEGQGAVPASNWILNRLARLQLLAARLRETVPAMDHFVTPAVSRLPTLERNPDDQPVVSDDGLNAALEALNERSPLETMVLYITSDAGEGKTSLINQLAREQAQSYIDNRTDWLLVPIPLGGRHFLRFDDITVGVMQNRYRFPFLYYQSFLSLVKMGVIVPAFDGFEEMFVESSSGEALSAMGILVSSLDSRGALVVAARKAYFEFENVRTQERLFDTIKSYSVGFSKLELHRWRKSQFVLYCHKRGVENPEQLYRRISERLAPDHALLTRAVLVKRLIDVANKVGSLDALLNQLQQSGAEYFSVFVRSLIEREADEKWLDRSGEKEAGTPLMTIDEHCELLSQVALAMWDAKIDYLKSDALEFTADYFCESSKKNAFQARQIRSRTRDHAMLVRSTHAPDAVEFDHDEFRQYFLGEGVALQLRPLDARAKAEVFRIARRGPLPDYSILALSRSLARDETLNKEDAISFLMEVANMDARASYAHENVSKLVIDLLNDLGVSGIVISSLTFGPDSLRDKKIAGVQFRGCYFSATSLDLAVISECGFFDCTFSQLRITSSTRIVEVSFEGCTVDSVALSDRHREVWDPAEIRRLLESAGVTFHEDAPKDEFRSTEQEFDPEIVDLGKLTRYFMRSTHMSESVIRMKLGGRGQAFIDGTLPHLTKHGLLVEIKNQGGGDQRRFRLGVGLQAVNDAIARSDGNFERFLARFD